MNFRHAGVSWEPQENHTSRRLLTYVGIGLSCGIVVYNRVPTHNVGNQSWPNWATYPSVQIKTAQSSSVMDGTLELFDQSIVAGIELNEALPCKCRRMKDVCTMSATQRRKPLEKVRLLRKEAWRNQPRMYQTDKEHTRETHRSKVRPAALATQKAHGRYVGKRIFTDSHEWTDFFFISYVSGAHCDTASPAL